MKPTLLFFFSILFVCCGSIVNPEKQHSTQIQPTGATLQDRIAPPVGYSRVSCDSNSFGHYLRTLKLKPDGSPVLLYTGIEKPWQHVHCAVVDMEIGKRDLQQCADACIRLRAEYLWRSKKYSEIHFHLTNGFQMEYTKWRQGFRLAVDGNNTSWVKKENESTSYESFRQYLDKVFMYAGTLSVAKEIKPRSLDEIEPGDLFVVGGSPGHASMAVDVVINEKGERLFLLAQGYMPAQEIHIIKNPNDADISPWFRLRNGETLSTMEWDFREYTLGYF